MNLVRTICLRADSKWVGFDNDVNNGVVKSLLNNYLLKCPQYKVQNKTQNRPAKFEVCCQVVKDDLQSKYRNIHNCQKMPTHVRKYRKCPFNYWNCQKCKSYTN